uniref:EF-hand domain-containing protein n=1 Tax=Timema shepardi TaxID=629360 RepID=A0A7R9B2V9_TIMSH|nr:unnamed protein product [Timema shepardi]
MGTAEQSDDALADEIQRAHVICVVYSVDDDDTLDKVTTRWLPFIRECIPDTRCPVILVGNKVDLVDFSTIECSAKTLKNISEMFYYAQKAVLHPTLPLYVMEQQDVSRRARGRITSDSVGFKPQARIEIRSPLVGGQVSSRWWPALLSLTEGCKKALVRIFKICDVDNDDLLNDTELNAFQRRCFNAPLQPQVLEDVKAVLKKNLTDGIADECVTLKVCLTLAGLVVWLVCLTVTRVGCMVSVPDYDRVGCMVSVPDYDRVGCMVSVPDYDRVGCTVSVPDSDRVGCMVSVPDYDRVGCMVSVPDYDRVGCTVSVPDSDRVGCTVSVPDSDRVGCMVSVPDYDRVGCMVSVPDYDRVGCTVSVPDSDRVGCMVSVPDYDRFGCTVSVPDYDRVGCTVSVPDYDRVGCMVSVPDSDRVGCTVSVPDWQGWSHGFLFLHCLFIQRGRNETTWAVLRKFGYNDNLQITKEYLHPRFKTNYLESGLSCRSIRVPAGCTTELSLKGQHFVSTLFERYDKDRDGALSPAEVNNLFTPCPAPLWGPDFHRTVATNSQGWITQQGFMCQWVLVTLLDLNRALEYLAYLGYIVSDTENQVTAIQGTRNNGRPNKYFAESKIPVLIVANKSDQEELRQEYLLQPAAFCSRHKLPPPHLFTASNKVKRDVFVKLATMAAFPKCTCICVEGEWRTILGGRGGGNTLGISKQLANALVGLSSTAEGGEIEASEAAQPSSRERGCLVEGGSGPSRGHRRWFPGRQGAQERQQIVAEATQSGAVR